VSQDKVKGMPTDGALPTREENPLAGEDKELGLAERVDSFAPPDEEETNPIPTGSSTQTVQVGEEGSYYEQPDGSWDYVPYDTNSTPEQYEQMQDPDFGGFGANPDIPPGMSANDYNKSLKNGWSYSNIPGWVGAVVKNRNGESMTIYYDPERPNLWSGNMGDQEGSGGSGGGRIMNTVNPNYFSGQMPQKPDDMGSMEWHYKFGNGMYSNQFNPESFYYNPDDKGNAGQTSSPYSRISNSGNMKPEVVKSNRPFYDDNGIDKYANAELKWKQRQMTMAEATDAMQMPTDAGVDQAQGQTQEVDEQIQEQLKEAIMEAGFNIIDISLSPEGKIMVTVGQFEDSYMENAQYFEQDFELAEPMKCSRRFKAIAVTPGMYKAKDGTLVELSSEQLQNIAGLFRNKPLVLVDHELARPDSTHEGRSVGYIEDSYYDGDYDAVIYKGVLSEDLDLADIAGSSIKLSHGRTPMGRHIALIPKCIPGRACYAPQDPNAVILENAKRIGEDKMGMTPQQAATIKKELEHINKQKESLIDSILKTEIEAGTLKGNIFDRTRELWKSDAGVLLEMASVVKTEGTPSTKSKVEGRKEISLARKVEKGEIDPEDALVYLIENDPFFKS
jgi:hypothetical protein